MKTLWLLYDDIDFAVNQGFACMLKERGKPLGLDVQAVVLSELVLGMDENGQPTCLRNGQTDRPDAVLSRQRESLISEHFERTGIPVFNNSLVCRICNDKRITYQFLHANFGHVLFNMWALYFFGPAVEHIMGSRKFLAYYLSCGVAGALFSSLLAGMGIYSMVGDDPQSFMYVNALVHQFTDYTGTVEPWQMIPMIGASAAVYGVMVCVAYMFPNERISLLFPPVTMTMRTFALVVIAIASATILFNFDNAGGEAGHLGGIILGALVMTVWKWRTRGNY